MCKMRLVLAPTHNLTVDVVKATVEEYSLSAFLTLLEYPLKLQCNKRKQSSLRVSWWLEPSKPLRVISVSSL